MRLYITLTLGLVLVLATSEISHAERIRRDAQANQDRVKAITQSDIKAGYDHVVARYASWTERKKQEQGHGQVHLYMPEEVEVAPPAPVTKRGTMVNLHAVGGYPKMLGQTYNAVVGIGTPAQLFNLTADTGSMLTWAVQSSCSEKDCPGVKNKNLYDATKSTTSKPLRSDHEAYGDGEMDLELFSDVVNLAQVQITGATVGGANKTFAKDGMLEHDGLLGLGRRLDADPEPVLDTLVKQNKQFDHTIAIDLGPQPSIEIGGHDYLKYRKMSNFRIESDEGWLLSRSRIVAEGAPPAASVGLLLDTGSSVSMLPSSRMDAIMNRPGLKVKRAQSEPIIYSMPCDTKLGVQMMLPDGTQVPIRDQDLLMQSNDPTMPGCLSLLVGTTNPFLPSVAGTPILKSMYTVLRKTPSGDWIGLAPLQTATPK